ncbi:MAG: class I SAM-dependent methyltransferase [Planctomycetes bacterium]|nr:class I SAM-dependent methyltransferase [Planctomycetota bacterium]
MIGISLRSRVASIGVFAAALVGCAPAETSVRPGVNAEYQKPDLAKWTDRFESESREIFHERLAIMEAMQIRPGMVVADVGAGTGFFAEMFAHQVGGEGRVYAVDIVDDFLKRIADRSKQSGLNNITVIKGTERDTRLPAACADIVFICDTYHHFEFPRSSLASIHRALRPGGSLIVIDFDRVPGTSRQWVLDHVRAGQDDVQREIESAGFQFVERVPTPFLKENYMLRFKRK